MSGPRSCDLLLSSLLTLGKKEKDSSVNRSERIPEVTLTRSMARTNRKCTFCGYDTTENPQEGWKCTKKGCERLLCAWCANGHIMSHVISLEQTLKTERSQGCG